MAKHIIDSDQYGNCLIECNVRQGIMIGSVACQMCENCYGREQTDEHNYLGPSWIRCSKLEDALAKEVL